MTLLDLLTGCWAIQPEKLLEIQAIYATHLRGDKIDIAGVEARLGRPLHSEQQVYTLHAGGVAVLSISGVIAPKANLIMQMSGGLSTQAATKQLESAIADPRVRSIIQVIDSPGGAVTGTPELASAVREMATIKPIVTLSDGLMASAGYWIGAAGNAVYISGPTVQVGSIGVVFTHDYNPRAAETRTEITAGKYKRSVSAIAPLSEDGRALIQDDVDYVYSMFVDAVAGFRGVSSQQVLDHMADGRVFRGQRAIDAGLVDGVTTLDALIERMATQPDDFSARRKAVFAIAAPAVTPAGAQAAAPPAEPVPLATSTQPEGDPMDRATLAAQHPELLSQLQAEFTTAGAAAELIRSQAVRAQSLPGHEQLIATLAADGKTTGPEAAAAVLAAERSLRAAAAAAHVADAPTAAKPSAAPADKGGKSSAEMVAEAQAYMAAHPGSDVVAALKALGHAR